MISGSFAKNDLQLKAFYGFSPPCMCIVFLFQKNNNVVFLYKCVVSFMYVCILPRYLKKQKPYLFM